jgi:hypothetical protein
VDNNHIGQPPLDDNRDILLEQIASAFFENWEVIFPDDPDPRPSEAELLSRAKARFGNETRDQLLARLRAALNPIPDQSTTTPIEKDTKGFQRLLYRTWEALRTSDLSPVERLILMRSCVTAGRNRRVRYGRKPSAMMSAVRNGL